MGYRESYDLFLNVFAEEIEENGELDLFEIPEVDGVTEYDEKLMYNEGWYNFYLCTFRYKGKVYAFEYARHTSDNVCDTRYEMDTFHEYSDGRTEMSEAIDNIISQIENETYSSWEEILEDLEDLKKLV